MIHLIKTLFETLNTYANLLLCVVTAFYAHLLFKSFRVQKLSELNIELSRIFKMVIDHPYLDNPEYCRTYDNTKITDENIRYHAYCCCVFNLLNSTWKLFKGNKEKIDSFNGGVEFIKQHKTWWETLKDDEGTIFGYEKEFIKYVDSYLTKKP